MPKETYHPYQDAISLFHLIVAGGELAIYRLIPQLRSFLDPHIEDNLDKGHRIQMNKYYQASKNVVDLNNPNETYWNNSDAQNYERIVAILTDSARRRWMRKRQKSSE